MNLGNLLEFYSSVSFDWKDLIDILLVSYLIYRVFLMIKGTLATQILLGIIVLFIAAQLADMYELHAFKWILSQFWAVWVLVLVVIFQPELRRALAQVGLWRFYSKRSAAGEIIIEEIVQAAMALSASKTGALIVIEKAVGLRHFVEMGIPIEARVTSELLRTIFFPDSPLHDGAVIIQNSQIAAASCFLPLTKSPVDDTELGTRHRAALGLSDESDAIVIVVSEETGIVSVAYERKLTRGFNYETLKKFLLQILMPTLYRKLYEKGTKED